MPADPQTQIGDLALAAVTVTAVAVPLALVGWATARALGQPLMPRRIRLRAGWTGPDIVLLFLLSAVFNTVVFMVLSGSGFFQSMYGPEFPAKGNAGHQQVQALWSSLFATPLLLLAAAGLWFGIHHRPARTRASDLPGQVALGAIGWAALTPIVFAVNLAALVLVNLLGGTVEDHPLVQTGVESVFEKVFFALVVCFVTPLIEEFLFRGLLVRWAAGRSFRPWVLLGIAVGLSCFRNDGALTLVPAAFIAGLAGLLLTIVASKVLSSVATRELAGVYASAAVFAAAHSAVWPSPVPLFVLGLGLGYLALRTGGIAACVVLHGLFNAVSFVFLLRGGAG